jgi:hypothetical protein
MGRATRNLAAGIHGSQSQARVALYRAMSLRFLVGVLAILVSAGCASPPKAPKPWGKNEVETFGKLARPPAMFAVTVSKDSRGAVKITGGNRTHEGQAAEERMLSGGDAPAPIINLRPGGPGNFKALIDTSSKHSWLAQAGVQNANIIPMGPPLTETRALHVANAFPGLLCIAPKIRLGDKMSIEDVLYYVHAATGPLGVLARGEASPAPDAVLGVETIKAFSFVTMDFGRRMVSFAASREYRPTEEMLVARVPMREVAGAIACDGAIDGEPATIILDTGGNYGFAVENPQADPYRQVSVGDLVFRDVKADSTEQLGLGQAGTARLGRQRLARFIVTFDFKKRVIWFERPR